jgi:phosphate transport system protein
MTVHFQRELGRLKKRVLSLSALVEQRVHQAVKSVEERDGQLAQQVIDGDDQIDHEEVEIEEDCLKILALHQPVAVDLRFIVAVLKINNDLERIGDLAVNIAERAAYLATSDTPELLFDFPGMAAKGQAMLRHSLEALVNLDPRLAWQVCANDDEVDAINRQMYDQVKREIRNRPEYLEPLVHLLSISRLIERMADQATNIAEDVIYMVEGEIVRHRTEDYGAQAKAD